MKHLITGGSGFLGNLVALELFRRGESVRILDIWEDPNRPRDIEYIQCDIRDREGVRRALEGVDIVHHNVALVPLTKSGKKFWEVNVDGTRIAAEEAVRAGVRSFIHMSSSAIFGVPKTVPIMADTPPTPAEIYGRGKWAGEQAVREVCGKGKLDLVVIRPRTVLGEGRLGIFQILFNWIRENRAIYIIGSGNNRLQFIHARDLMDAYMLALDVGKPGVYNVGTDQFGTLRNSLETLIQHAGSTSKVKSLPERLTVSTLQFLDWLHLSPLAPYHYLTYHKPYYFDVKPLLDLGWKPAYSNDRMLAESYDWFCKNGQSLARDDGASPHRKAVAEGILRIVRKFS
ncbi:MAG: NAD-dependent epimerase/dehydratase family protein [Tepidisphaeraceae bacterium]|jgi:nucleoside-diphosphate-sugar epimerase